MGDHFVQEKLNLDDLYTRSREMELNRSRIYNKILQRAHRKIKVTSRQRHNERYCFFLVPEFLVGVPTYDITTCITHIMEELSTNCFLVRYTHPNLLFISWKHYIPAYSRLEIKKRYGVKINGFGEVLKDKKQEETKKPGAKTTSTANKIFKAVSTYKPTGKLIYGDDLLKRIDVKST